MAEKRKGFFLVLAGALLFSIGGVCSKFNGWNGLSLNGVRCLLAMIPLGAYLILTKHKLVINRKVALGAVFHFLTASFCMLANKLTTAANSIILQYAAPIYIILFYWIFKKQRPRWLDISTCAIVLIGLVFFVIDGLSVGGTLGNALGGLSGLTYAGFFIVASDKSSDNMSMVFFGFLLSAVVGLPFLAWETDFSSISLLTAVILGFLQMGVAYPVFSAGLRLSGAVTGSLISGIEPILNPIWVALLYKETMSGTAIVGAVIVIAGILGYNAFNARQTADKPV